MTPAGPDVLAAGSDRPPRRVPRGGLALAVLAAASAAVLVLRGPGPAHSPGPLPPPATATATAAVARLYVASCTPDTVVRLDRYGEPVRLAGTPGSGTSADGHPVATGRNHCPDGLVFDAAGLLHVVGPEASNLRLVGADGGVRSLDGRLRDKRRSLGLRAMLQSPDAVAVDRHGLIYVGELTGDRVLRADARGDVHPLRAAGPAPQPVRDPARPALLAVLNDLSVCFADGGTNSVYRVDRDGRTSRLAGTGVPGGRGDGGQAALAQLDDPRDIAVDPVGRLYVSEGAGHRVRRIELDGTVHTVAGTGAPGSTGDGGPATAATVTTPGDLAVGPAGDLFIVDLAAAAVRRVMPDGRIVTLGN